MGKAIVIHILGLFSEPDPSHLTTFEVSRVWFYLKACAVPSSESQNPHSSIPVSEEPRMSGGIARGRLAEERKSWRKNHPHVRALSFNFTPSYLPCFSPSLFLYLFFYLFIRVLWLSRRLVQMGP